jgi:hypothetical protein
MREVQVDPLGPAGAQVGQKDGDQRHGRVACIA